MLDELKRAVAEYESRRGRRLDRRRRYGVVNGNLCVLEKWTGSCPGCYEGGDYEGMAHLYLYDSNAGCRVGAGCEECGYTGKMRREQWVPLEDAATNERRGS